MDTLSTTHRGFCWGIVFVPYLELALRPTPIAHRLAVVAGLLFAVVNVSRDLRTFATANQTASVVAFNNWAAAAVPPDATVAGDLTHLPLYRRGVFYHLASSSPPNGYSTEAALREMNLPSSFSDRMTPAAYDRELETERPFLIVRGDLLSLGGEGGDQRVTWTAIRPGTTRSAPPVGPCPFAPAPPPAIALPSRDSAARCDGSAH